MTQKVSEVYSELAHYTTATGLKGILESQCLWATHARFLNDSREYHYFFDSRCPALIIEVLTDGLRTGKLLYEGQPASQRLKEALNFAPKAAAEFTSSIRKVTLDFDQPHLLSLCETSDPRIMRDGLLSQWRAYGRDGGYALIFDSEQFEDRLGVEASAFRYQHFQIGNVYYFDEDGTSDNPEPEILEAEESLQAGLLQFYQDQDPESFVDCSVAISSLCSMYKHWGFHEEHEIRVVAIPTHPSALEEPGKDDDLPPPKPVKTFIRDGCLVPYIELFTTPPDGEKQTPLPINRILVGPNRDAERRREAITHMLNNYGLDCSVIISRIPFIGSNQ